MKHVLEVGSSSLLKFQFPDDITKYQASRTNGSVYFDALGEYDIIKEYITGLIKDNKLDLIVFSLGKNTDRTPFHESDLDEFMEVFAVNFFSIVEITKHAIAENLKNRPEGRLSFLFINSQAGLGSYPNHMAYSTSKAALNHFCDNLTEEYSHNKGFKFVSVYPGMIATKLSGYRGRCPLEYFNRHLLPRIRLLMTP